MKKLKEVAKQLPVLSSVYRILRERRVRRRSGPKDPEQLFTKIYETNQWRGHASVSGRGSDVDQTRILVKELPSLFQKLRIATVLDIPCGDFLWMKDVDLNGLDYLGADIVKSLIQKNAETYHRSNVRFQAMNLVRDKLPRVDLVFSRDCLVHLSFSDIFKALTNICESGSEYLLTTTFPDRQSNEDIPTGDWRPLNLELPPFRLPRPVEILVEGCTVGEGEYRDKALGLWRVAQIRESLAEGGV